MGPCYCAIYIHGPGGRYIGNDHVDYWDGHEFPVLKSSQVVQDARASMRWVFENIEEAKAKNEELSKRVRRLYGMENVARLVGGRLFAIRKGMRR